MSDNAPDTGVVWMSACSRHGVRDPNCDLCSRGHWVSKAELLKDRELWLDDYAKWYKQSNYGREPDEQTRLMYDPSEPGSLFHHYWKRAHPDGEKSS